MDKKELRKKVLTHLRKDEVQDKNICEKVIKIIKEKNAKTVFAYISVKNEVGTGKLIHRLLELGVRVCIPKIKSDGNMVALEITSLETLIPDKYDIPSAPDDAKEIPKDEIDLAVVPGVAFTHDGYRLGRGGGYYDRFLSDCNAYKLAVCYKSQLVSAIPAEGHDVLMDSVITG